MRKSLRLVLASAVGAAVLATGAAITVASPANAGSAAVFAAPSIGNATFTDAFIPPTGSTTIPFKVQVTDVYVGDKAPNITVLYYKDGEATSGAGTAANVTQLTDTSGTKPTEFSGSVPVKSSDKPGKWHIKIAIDLEGSADNPDTKIVEFTVDPATRVTGVSVTPNPVYLKSGKEIDVDVEATIDRQGGTITDVRLEAADESEHYSLTTDVEDDGSYHGGTSMDYSTGTGAWRVKFTIKRGGKTYEFARNFEVRKSNGKAISRITLYAAPPKVVKGKSTKLFGKVYRGSKGWASKILKVYFKKKGTKKWVLVGYVEATKTGKYSKTVKPKYDGYWCTRAMGTSKTYGSLSKPRFVDVI